MENELLRSIRWVKRFWSRPILGWVTGEPPIASNIDRYRTLQITSAIVQKNAVEYRKKVVPNLKGDCRERDGPLSRKKLGFQHLDSAKRNWSSLNTFPEILTIFVLLRDAIAKLRNYSAG